MSPTERAQDFVSKFGKEVAVKVVDEIIDALSLYDEFTEKHLKDEFGLEYFSAELQNMDGDFRYWDKVKYYLKKSEELWAVAVQVGKIRPKLSGE
jgi:hypothetical protein